VALYDDCVVSTINDVHVPRNAAVDHNARFRNAAPLSTDSSFERFEYARTGRTAATRKRRNGFVLVVVVQTRFLLRRARSFFNAIYRLPVYVFVHTFITVARVHSAGRGPRLFSAERAPWPLCPPHTRPSCARFRVVVGLRRRRVIRLRRESVLFEKNNKTIPSEIRFIISFSTSGTLKNKILWRTIFENNIVNACRARFNRVHYSKWIMFYTWNRYRIRYHTKIYRFISFLEWTFLSYTKLNVFLKHKELLLLLFFWLEIRFRVIFRQTTFNVL